MEVMGQPLSLNTSRATEKEENGRATTTSATFCPPVISSHVMSHITRDFYNFPSYGRFTTFSSIPCSSSAGPLNTARGTHKFQGDKQVTNEILKSTRWVTRNGKEIASSTHAMGKGGGDGGVSVSFMSRIVLLATLNKIITRLEIFSNWKG